ncbi:MAG: radical SAM protein [Gemmatimonadota bacterium]|nr:MAG: radical SAM protein [Gemmatimonadota bacterium]
MRGTGSHRATKGNGGALPVLDRRRRGTKFVELPPRSVINSPESTRMGFWSLNPYVGCEFGCTYCYARYAHRYVVERAHDDGRITDVEFADLQHPRGLEPFEHRIFVKSRDAVLSALDRDLNRVRRRTTLDGPQSIVVGSGTDPYQPAERQYQVTRTVLARLRGERGFRIGIISKSPLVTRDIDILRDLARRHWLSVYVSLTCVDVRVIKIFEARSPMPHARLRALERLSGAGIRAGLIVAPILPGITDTVPQIDALMRAAKAAGAQFVVPIPLRLYPDVQRRFLPLVERHYPDLASRYRTAYGSTWNAPEEYVTALRQRFHRIASIYGIPESAAEGEEEATHHAARAAQLNLFANWPGEEDGGFERC